MNWYGRGWNKEQRKVNGEEEKKKEDKLAVLHITHEWNMRRLQRERQGANEANHWPVPTLCLLVPMKLNYSPLSFLCRCPRFLLPLIVLVLWVYKLQTLTRQFQPVSCISIRPTPGRVLSFFVCQELVSRLIFWPHGYFSRYKINTRKLCGEVLVSSF